MVIAVTALLLKLWLYQPLSDDTSCQIVMAIHFTFKAIDKLHIFITSVH